MTETASCYCIDSSCFIDMARHQPQDVFPNLWDNMMAAIEEGHIVIHRMVRDEVIAKDDDVAAWMKSIPLELIVDIDAEQAAFVTRMTGEWKQLATIYQQPENASKADPFLIAAGWTRGCCVVTNEGPREWKIPDVCRRYDIQTMTHLELIRELKWTF